jgi:TRAP-type C4-dicarboxylate transport system permease small subunit
MKALRLLSRTLARAETALLVLFLTAMIVLSFLQVVLRNLFGSGLIWGDVVVRQMVLWGGFMGAALAAIDDRHISIDALTKYLPPRIRSGVKVATNLFAAAVCFFLARAGWAMVVDERGAGGELLRGVPGWIPLVIIPIGYLLLAIHFTVNAVENGVRAAGREAA